MTQQYINPICHFISKKLQMDTPPNELSRKQILLLTILCLHFGLILFKTFREYPLVRIVFNNVSAIRFCAEYYTQLAVLQADYSFFSPNIASDHDVKIDVIDMDSTKHDASFVFPNSEVEKRFHTCVLALQHLQDSVQDVVVKSWAARTFDAYPNAKVIKIRIERAKVPPMEAYATGKRKEPEKILELVFETN
jgi:hypothetical protein